MDVVGSWMLRILMKKTRQSRDCLFEFASFQTHDLSVFGTVDNQFQYSSGPRRKSEDFRYIGIVSTAQLAASSRNWNSQLFLFFSSASVV